MRIASLLLLCLTLAAVPAVAQLYSNGICSAPNLCSVDAWTVGFGFSVTDSFSVPAGSTVTSADIAVWLFPGDGVSGASVQWGLGSSAFGSDIGAGLSTPSLVTDFGLNQFGFDVQEWNFDIFGTNLPSTAWLTLLNISVPSGDPVYWDENSGPSMAQESSVGTIPSESFDINGTTTTSSTVPEPSSIMLFGSGILGLAGVLRRKLF